MTEEVKPQEGTPENKEPQYTDIEQKALDMGWRPREDFDGSDDDFIDAKEFVRRKPLFDKIEHTGKELKNVKKALDALKIHYTKVQETEYNRALKELKAARKEAISNSDGDAFDTIDAEIKNVESQMETVKQAQSTPAVEEPQVNPEFVNWTNRNSWYTSVKYMQTWADDFGAQLIAQGVTPREVLKRVEEAVRKEFPHKFTNPNKAQAPDVESGRGSQRTGSRKDDFQLTEQEERIMNTLIKADPKTFNKEKYIADLKAVKGIK